MRTQWDLMGSGKAIPDLTNLLLDIIMLAAHSTQRLEGRTNYDYSDGRTMNTVTDELVKEDFSVWARAEGRSR